MVEFHGQVSHRLARAKTLQLVRAGRKSHDQVCDADFLLLTAAKFHGVSAANPCPICAEETLRNVLWVYGEQLGNASGSARSVAEIQNFANSGREFIVHTVEVCTNCKWNHLVQAAIAAPSARTPVDVEKLEQTLWDTPKQRQPQSAVEEVPSYAVPYCVARFEEEL
ncbi:hypothetical protein CMUST_15015 [Corynebacterium mustelae]|uniref:DUF5318 family protein n=1 Tax=Corynebacterium mustelae TaxID=571915 RepID=A0A0G3H840_9CORY|nr:hypothetical protein CMUST_15015 [Corynebacterium mustelae]